MKIKKMLTFDTNGFLFPYTMIAVDLSTFEHYFVFNNIEKTYLIIQQN